MPQHFNPPNVWQPFGAFSLGVVQGEGQIVYLKGQVSLDSGGEVIGKGDMQAQLRQTLENIRAVLGHVGGTLADVISLTQYVTDIEQFMAAGAIRQEFFKEPFPVTTTIEVSRLYHPELMVEITAIAEIPTARFIAPEG